MRMRGSRVAVGMVLAAVAATALMVVGAPPAAACSCVLVEPEDALRAADGALVGVVDTVDDAAGDAASWTLTVTDWVKGRLTQGQVVVDAPIDTAACGLGDPAGEFGLFVRLREDRLTGSLCDVTTPEVMRGLVGPDVGLGEVASVAGFPLASPGLEVVVTAQQASDGRIIERTWLGWLSGFVAVAVVVGAAAGAVALIRRRATHP